MAMTQQETIKKFMASLDKTTKSGTAAVDEAVKACSNFSSAQDIINNLLADRAKATSGDDFLKTYCGINLDNADTGAITGKDAGGSKIKTGTSVVPEDSKVKWTYPSGNSFTKHGLKFIVPTNIKDDEVGSAYDKAFIIGGLYTWWADEALKLIEDSYGYSFSDNEEKVTQIDLIFKKDPDTSWLAWVSYYPKESGKTTELSLTINMQYYYNMVGDADENCGGTDNLLDRTIAHELTHAIMAAKILNYGSLPLFIREGVAELTHGIDDQRYLEILALAPNNGLLEYCFENGELEYATGYLFLRYLAKQAECYKFK